MKFDLLLSDLSASNPVNCDTGLGDWDVVERCDIPSPGKINVFSSQDRLVNKLTDKLTNLFGPGMR